MTTLDAHCFGHGKNSAITSCRRETRKPYAGIAAGRLDNNGVGFNFAFALGFFNHCLSDSVLDGAGGVEVFELNEERAVEFDLGGEIFSLKQRSIAD